MSSRSLMGCLLASSLLAGCDRQSPAPVQPSAPASAPASARTSAPANGTAGPAASDEVAPDEVAAASKPADKLDRSHKGEAAPGLAFEDPAGKPVTLAAFKGKPVLVNLWATWCAPCVAELPTLGKLAASNTIRVVAVSQDSDAAKVAPFLAARKVALTPYRDPKLGLSVAYRANLPTTILYDATGHEVWRMNGGFAWDGLEAKKLIAEAG